MRKRCHAMRSTLNVSGRLPPGLCRVRWAVAALSALAVGLCLRVGQARANGAFPESQKSSSRRRRRRPTSIWPPTSGSSSRPTGRGAGGGAASRRRTASPRCTSSDQARSTGSTRSPRWALPTRTTVDARRTVSKGFAGLTVLDYFPDPHGTSQPRSGHRLRLHRWRPHVRGHSIERRGGHVWARPLSGGQHG